LAFSDRRHKIEQPAARRAVNVSLQGNYNAVRPDNGADWQLRSQLTFTF
jgi:hypothetical protein